MLTFALYCLGLLAISLLQEVDGSDFSDLGRKLLGGFVLAVVVAIAFTIIKLRLRDKHPPAAFISIASSREKEVTPKSTSD
jgi:hypothetical protein